MQCSAGDLMSCTFRPCTYVQQLSYHSLPGNKYCVVALWRMTQRLGRPHSRDFDDTGAPYEEVGGKSRT